MIIMPHDFYTEFKLASLSTESIVKWTQDLLQVYASAPSENAKQDLLRLCTRERKRSHPHTKTRIPMGICRTES